ncbi:hypothetical protein [Streptomyces sp. NPDC096339]|uniref:hypothetical protein n=1 Tax=Streptomyces sp. NPDC096339 TaxID=3366086 RepID=UPI003822339B
MSAPEEELIGHSYTRARKHPLVIGKLPGAGRLPGGPYTITQVMTMVVTFGALVMTKDVWAHFGAFNFIVMAVLPWGLAWALRYARLDGRDPAKAARSLFVYSSTPAQGRLAGTPQRPTRPRLVSGSCTVRVRSAKRPAPEPEPAKAPAPAPVTTSKPIPPRKQVRPRKKVRPTTPQPAPSPAPSPVPTAAEGRQQPKTGLQALLAALDDHTQA